MDARTIAYMLMSNVNLNPYTDIAYHNSELKSLTRYRFDKVKQRATLKSSVSRLVNILLTELENLFPTLHTAFSYALLSELPSARHVSEAHLTYPTNLLYKASKGRCKRDKAIQIRDVARNSIGTYISAKVLELKHTIKLIQELNTEIEQAIKTIMDKINSPMTSMPSISTNMEAMIIAEVGDFNNFNSPDKILAFLCLSPSTYQSGKLSSCYAHIEKRGSRYLRYALFNPTKFVCNWNPIFTDYLAKKRSEGKHYNVAISHATKKLVRLIFAMQKSGHSYILPT